MSELDLSGGVDAYGGQQGGLVGQPPLQRYIPPHMRGRGFDTSQPPPPLPQAVMQGQEYAPG
jgi:hypothetical protein